MQKIWTYDVEVFPNYFSVIFQNYRTREYKIFEKYQDRDQTISLDKFIREDVTTLVGYNNLGYDRYIMNAVLAEESNARIYSLSNEIINNQEPIWKNPGLKRFTRKREGIEEIDLMSIHALHKLGVSLKQVGVILNVPVIQEFELDWNLPLDLERDRENLLKYNKNDVFTTTELLTYSIKDLQLRRKVSKRYGVDVMNASRTKIGKNILEYYYEKETGISKKTFLEWRTHRPLIDVSSFIGGFEYHNKSLQSMYKDLHKLILYPDAKFTKIVKTKSMTHKMGQGGIHSENKPSRYKSDEKRTILDLDFGSFYPSIMLKYGIKPKHLGDGFLKVLETLTTQRLKAKADKDTVTADTLKIVINSLYGLLGSDTYFLYDQKAMYMTTILGQLTILKLIDRYELIEGVECIYSNTDGASFLVDNDKMADALNLCKELEEEIGITLEYDLYKEFILRNVNNFIWIKNDGKIKTKGMFEYSKNVTKGYRHPIVSDALVNYFINGVKPEETIKREKNIHRFLVSQKVNKKFQVIYHRPNKIMKVQHVNRYFASTKAGSLIKYNPEDGKEIALMAGQNIFLANEVRQNEDYFKNIDYKYYIHECNKVIEEFEHKQLELF